MKLKRSRLLVVLALGSLIAGGGVSAASARASATSGASPRHQALSIASLTSSQLSTATQARPVLFPDSSYPTYPYDTNPAPHHPAPSHSPTLTPALRPPVRLTPPLEGVVTTSVAGWDTFTRHTAQLADNYVAVARNGGVLPSTWLLSAIRADDGAEPVIEILPNDPTTPVITLSSIARGRRDSWLLALKAQIAALKRPVVISFAPEPNGRWYSWGLQPKEFVAAYQHVHDVIGDGTATAPVTWMWQPSAINDQAESMPRQYWPGASFVDWVGLDGYYYVNRDSFGMRFSATLKVVKRFWRGPVIIGETGISPHVANGPADIANLFAGVAAHHLLGLIFFDIKQKCPAQGCGQFHGDFALQNEPSAWAAAYRTAVNGSW